MRFFRLRADYPHGAGLAFLAPGRGSPRQLRATPLPTYFGATFQPFVYYQCQRVGSYLQNMATLATASLQYTKLHYGSFGYTLAGQTNDTVLCLNRVDNIFLRQ